MARPSRARLGAAGHGLARQGAAGQGQPRTCIQYMTVLAFAPGQNFALNFQNPATRRVFLFPPLPPGSWRPHPGVRASLPILLDGGRAAGGDQPT